MLGREGAELGPWLNRFYSLGTQHSFTFPQVDVDDAADQGEGESHPGQGEAVAEAAPARVLFQDLLRMDGVDQCPSEHGCTWGTGAAV